MVDTPTKITQLPAGSALTGTEVAPFVQGGATVKITANQIATFVNSSIFNSGPVFVGSLSPPVLPNGSDQTSNLQAAIDTYTASGGAVLQFGVGTYIFNSAIVLKPNIILRGIGIDITILKVGLDNVTLIDRWGSSGGDTGVAGIENLTCYGFGDRNLSAGSNKLVNIGPFVCYWIRSVKGIYSRNMTFTGIGTTGIIDSCLINQSYRDGINLTGTTYAYMIDNDITQVGDDAITFHVPNGTSGINDYSVRITGNSIEKSFGIKCLGARNTVIENNTLRFYYAYGIQVGLDTGSGEGLITKHAISITGNTLEDGLNGTTVGAGANNFGIYVFGGESLGSGGTAIAQYVGQWTGSVIQTPDVFVNKAGSAQPRGPTGAVSIVGNAIRQTLAGMTNFADAGFGNLWNNTGSINPAITTLIGVMIGVGVHDDCENLVISGNSMHGTSHGVEITGYLTNADISGNTIFRCGQDACGIHMVSNSFVSPVNGSIKIANNLIDVDPYLEGSKRTSPLDGSWTANDGVQSIALLINNYAGVTLTGNRIRNCMRVVKGVSTGYVVNENNYVEFDWTSANAGAGFSGIGNLSGVDACADHFMFCNSNPASASFNQYDQNFFLSSSSIPTTGAWFKGTFVKNTNPSIDGNNLTILGWIRLTSNANNVSGTDWAIARVSQVSPAT